VLVFTPANTHLRHRRPARAAGKHVLMEKPLDITTARAEALVADLPRGGRDARRRAAAPLPPGGDAAGRDPGGGRAGRIVGCSTVIRLWRPQSYYDEPGRGSFARDGGGVLISQGIHTLDLMLSLAGPIAEVTGFATTTPVHRMETEDMVCAAARFASGAFGTIDATTAAYPGFPRRSNSPAKGHATLRGTELLRAVPGRPRVEIEPDASGRRHRAPTRWPFRTTTTARSWPISSPRSARGASPGSPARRR
jgi:UDP-N-acetyl-2-amino-2-deoxyglucuronate dehydrogenase